MKFCVSSSSQNSSSTSAESSGVTPRRSASSSVSRCTSCFRQRAQNLLGQFLAHRHQQDRGLAHARQLAPTCAAALLRFVRLLRQGRFSFVLLLARFAAPFPRRLAPTGALPAACRRPVNRSESSSAAGANSASARASSDWSPARRSPAFAAARDPLPAAPGGLSAGLHAAAASSLAAPLGACRSRCAPAAVRDARQMP